MTCIVGWIEEDKKKGTRDVWIGGDSAGVSSSFALHIRADEKVFRNDNMLFGYTSSFRMGQILRYSFTVPEQSQKKTDYQYMCTDFMDGVAGELEKKKYAKVSSNEISIGTFIVGYKGNLYTIYDDLQVAQTVLNFASVGCGEEIAQGAMYTMKDLKMKPEVRIKKALEAAVEFSAGVRPPFLVMKL